MERDLDHEPPRKRRRAQNGTAQATPSEPLLSPPSPPSPPANHLRVYSWNINGIAPFIQPSIASYVQGAQNTKSRPDTPITTSLRNFLRRHHWPQILNLQEVKINPDDKVSQRAVEKAVNLCRSGPDDGPEYTVKFCLPRDRYNATGFGRKVYGVITIIRDDFLRDHVTTVREVDWDVEGRVLVVETRSKLAIWNIYAVNGTTNPYRDPTNGDVKGTRHDRKLAFHQSLLDECKRMESDGYRHVLAGDLNVARAPIDGYPKLRMKPEQHVKNREDFNTKFFDSEDGMQALDSYRHLNPKKKKYTYHPRNRDWKSSCDRVDMIILSKQLGEEGTLVGADILESEAERGPSDHVPLYVSLDLENIRD